MPVPIVVLEFRERWGRDPEPDELLPDQKRLCLECAQQTLDAETVRWLQTLGGLFSKRPDAGES